MKSEAATLEPLTLEPLSLEPLTLEPLSLEPFSLEPLTLEPPTLRTPEQPETSVVEQADPDTQPTIEAAGPVDPEASPDSTTPIESQDFLRDEVEGKRLPKPSPRTLPVSAGGEADDLEEEIPTSGTPTIDALVRKTRSEREERDSGSFLDSPSYDRRPPSIVVSDGAKPKDDHHTPIPPPRTSRTDAPVARTKPPPPSRQSSSRLGSLAVFLLAGAGIFFGARALQNQGEPEDTARSTEPSGLEVAPRPATEPVRAAELAPADPGADVGSAQVSRALENETASVKVPSALKPAPSRQKAGGVVGASSVSDDNETGVSPGLTAQVTMENEPTDVPFNENAAGLALDAAATRASTCRKDGDPSGMAIVTITFSQSGRVTTATISGPPFAGTETGGCIASTMRDARVPPFAGDFMTVRKTVAIQ